MEVRLAPANGGGGGCSGRELRKAPEGHLPVELHELQVMPSNEHPKLKGKKGQLRRKRPKATLLKMLSGMSLQ